MATFNGNIPQPVSLSNNGDVGTWRGIGANEFNSSKIAAEDWLRAEQSAQMSYEREKEMAADNRAFNAAEAQKQRDFEERLANSSYQRAIADLKASGLNPVLAYENGGAMTPSGSSASYSGQSGGSSNGYSGSKGNNSLTYIIGGLMQLLAGSMSNATKIALNSATNDTRRAVANTYGLNNITRDKLWRNYYDKNRK